MVTFGSPLYTKGGGTKEASNLGAIDRSIGKSASQAHEDWASAFRPLHGPSPPPLVSRSTHVVDLGGEFYPGRRFLQWRWPISNSPYDIKVHRESLGGKAGEQAYYKLKVPPEWGAAATATAPGPGPKGLLRCVGVMWLVFFRFTNSCRLDLHNKNPRVGCKNLDWESDVPCFGYGCRKCMFVGFLTGYTGPFFQLCFTVECRVVIDI